MTTSANAENTSADHNQQYLTSANPQWIQQLVAAKKEQGRNVFLLHFNIRDFVFDPDYPPSDPGHLLTVTEYLIKRLAAGRHIVLEYTLHGGLRAKAGSIERASSSNNTPGEDTASKRLRSEEYKALWKEVADKAADKPFSLVPQKGQHADDPSGPENWAQPRNVFPLLSRIFTGGYFIQPQASSERQSSKKTSGAPLSIALILDYLHHLAPPPVGTSVRHDIPQVIETLQMWSTSPELKDGNHVVIALTHEIAAVHPELTPADSYLKRIHLARPDRKQRADFLQWLSEFDQYPALQQEGMIDELANRASGMNYRELRDFVTTLTNNAEHWTEALADRRADIIRRESGGLLEPKESQYGLEDVAGYQYITQEVNRRLPRIRAGKADVAGILFNGPPGTGKSFYASALAKSGGVNMVVIRNLRGMYVGQSERNLEQIFEVARTLAPVMIFVDEIDQVFASRDRSMDTSGGVEQRLLGRLLEFMDDKTNLGKVIWIAASNRPDLIDQALLSRFKLRLPFLLPDRSTCIELLAHQLPHQAEFRWQSETWDEQIVDEVVSKYSGRELDTIVRQALWKAQDDAALLLDHSEAAVTRLAQRREQMQEHGLEVPRTPVIAVDDDDSGALEVHGQYLLEAVRDAEVGHDPQEYLVQSLRALNSAPFTSPALIEAVETALEPEVVDEIVIDGRLNKKAIGRLIEEKQPYGTGRSGR